MRQTLLKWLYQLFPFDLRGDNTVPAARDNIRISCVINFYGRLDLLDGILHSLAGQNYDRGRFEVVLIEDKGGTAAGKELADAFGSHLQTVYLPLDKNHGSMGYSRNFGLATSW